MRVNMNISHLLPLTRVAMCALVTGLAVACGQRPNTPVSPSAGGSIETAAAPDGSTLKAPAPTASSPTGGVQVDDPTTLTAATVKAKYADIPLQYRFQVRSGSTIVASAVVGPVSGSTVTWQPANLEADTDYTWRVQTTYQGADGPWSADAAFKSPIGAFIRGNEVRDPLTIGRTVGTPVGPVQITANGAKLLSHESRITYVLPQTLQEGQFSVMVTGIDEGSPGDKTKVMSMQEGFGDITTNDYRVTVEKRGASYPTPGAIQFRIITGDSRDEDAITDSFPRSVLELSDERWYYWEFSWRTGWAGLDVRSDSPTGPVIFHREVATNGRPYRPVPHVVHLGAPVGRAGLQDASIPGAVYKNVYVGPGPRPRFPN